MISDGKNNSSTFRLFEAGGARARGKNQNLAIYLGLAGWAWGGPRPAGPAILLFCITTTQGSGQPSGHL